MGRVPGRPQDKLDLSSTIDPETLPFLVADILAMRGHYDVKVVDGPGDGRRDVHSKTPDGAKHLAQCKFHSDLSKAVSSRETDELPLALNKFGARHGTFATTGRLSPQAAREYLENYPDFRLSFLDGTDLVDAVLSHPQLAAAWVNGDHITNAGRRLLVPAIVRIAGDEEECDPEDIIGQSGTEHLEICAAPAGAFAPYRRPKRFRLGRGGQDWVSASTCKATPNALHGIHTARHRLLERVQHLSRVQSGEAAQVRFGSTLIGCDDVATDRSPRLIVLSDEPESFIVTANKIVPEQAWLLPEDTAWHFPQRLSTLESAYACWISDSLDAWFRVELKSPEAENLVETRLLEYRRACLSASLFVAGTPTACRTLVRGLSRHDAPDRVVPHGPGGHLLAFLHPQARMDAGGRIWGDFWSGAFEVPQEPDFSARCARVRRAIGEGLTEVPWSSAEHIALAAGAPFIEEPAGVHHHSAELVHFFDEIASPVALEERRCMFVTWWRIPEAALVAVQTAISNVDADPERRFDRVYREARIAEETGEVYALFSLVLRGREQRSTQEILAEYQHHAARAHAHILTVLRESFPTIESASRRFWDEILGMPPYETILRNG